MQVQNDYSVRNNYSPNFRQVKHFCCTGFYGESPKYATKVVKALEENKVAMQFFKDFNVSLLLEGTKDGYNSVKSTLTIFYDNPGLSKWKKVWNFVTGNKPKVMIFAHCSEHREGDSTKILVKQIVGRGERHTGILTNQIEYERSGIKGPLYRPVSNGNGTVQVEQMEQVEEPLTQYDIDRNELVEAVKQLAEETRYNAGNHSVPAVEDLAGGARNNARNKLVSPAQSSAEEKEGKVRTWEVSFSFE